MGLQTILVHYNFSTGISWGMYCKRGCQSVVFGQNETWGVWSTWNESSHKVCTIILRSCHKQANIDARLKWIHNSHILNNPRLKMFDYIQSKDHRELALEAAIKSMVLLKNDLHNGLPILAPYKKACVSLYRNITILQLVNKVHFNSRSLDHS